MCEAPGKMHMVHDMVKIDTIVLRTKGEEGYFFNSAVVYMLTTTLCTLLLTLIIVNV